MYSHPLAAKMEAFWHDHAGRHNDPLWHTYLESYGHLLVTKLAEMGELHSNDGKFGMSKAGGCTRAASLSFMGEQQELSGSTRATFAIGHQVEVMALATLIALGYPVTNIQGPAVIEPFMASAIDGETAIDGVRTIVSVKSAGYKMSGYNRKTDSWKRFGFAQYPMDGVRATSPGYWAQAQAEQHALGVTQTMFIVVAKDSIKKMEDDPILKKSGSLTFYCEMVPHNAEFVRSSLLPVWGRQWLDVGGGNAGPAMYLSKSGGYVALKPGYEKGNKERTGTFDPCSYCALFDACRERILVWELENSLLLAPTTP